MVINSGVASGGVPTLIFLPWASLLIRGENFLTILMSAQVSCGDRASPHAGIEVPGTPLIIVLYKSSSLGSVPVGVDRNLKIPLRKSLGHG